MKNNYITRSLKKGFAVILSIVITISCISPALFSILAVDYSAYGTYTENISQNSKASAVLTAPVLNIATSSYESDGLNVYGGTVIVTAIKNFLTGTVEMLPNADRSFSAKLPDGAELLFDDSESKYPDVSGAQIKFDPESVSGNIHTWTITSGTATANSTVKFSIKYELNGKTYKASTATVTKYALIPSGWSVYLKRSNWLDTDVATSVAFNAMLTTTSISTPKGVGYKTYNGTSIPTYASGTSPFAAAADSSTSGFKRWTSDRYDSPRWYSGGGKTDRSDIGSPNGRAYMDVYVDKAMGYKNISSLGLDLCYWSNGSSSATMYQSGMHFFAGDTKYSTGDTNTAKYITSTAKNDKSQSLNNGYLNFTFSGTVPSSSTTLTMACDIAAGSREIDPSCAWLINFVIVDKTNLRTLVNTEINTYFRQESDGYTSASFSTYAAALLAAQTVINNETSTQSEIDTAYTNLTNAVSSLDYKEADYTALENAVDKVSAVIDSKTYLRPGADEDSSYFAQGSTIIGSGVFDPSYFENGAQSVLDILSNLPYGTGNTKYDSHYQAIIDGCTALLLSTWHSIPLLDADYSGVDQYLAYEQNGTILANDQTYPQYSGRYFEKAWYTSESIAQWDRKVNAVVKGYKIPYQKSVDDMKQGLVNAYANLRLQSASDSYTKLNALVITANALVSKTVTAVDPAGNGDTVVTYYTEQSVNAVNTVLNSIQSDLLIPEDDTVKGYYTSLQTAVNNLVLNNACYTYVNEQVANANAIDRSAYSTAALALLDEALVYDHNLKTDNQDAVNGTAQAIYSVLNGSIIPLKADYSELKSLLNTITWENSIASDYSLATSSNIKMLPVSSEDSSRYSGNSYSAGYYESDKVESVNNAVDAISWDLDITKQSTVNAYTAALSSSLKALSLIELDIQTGTNQSNEKYSNATKYLTAYTSSTETIQYYCYGTESERAAALTAVEALNVYLDTNAPYKSPDAQVYTAALNAVENISLTENNAYYTFLYTAVSLLPADYGTTGDLYDNSEAVNGYLTEYRNLDKSLAAEKVNQDTINELALNIYSAISALSYTKADYDALFAAIAAVPADLTVYSQSSVDSLELTISNAMKIQGVSDGKEKLVKANQQIIDTATQAILNAISNLTYRLADYSEVSTALIMAPTENTVYNVVDGNGIVKETVRQYSDESYLALTNALATIDYSLNINNQSTVDGYVTVINNAINGLVENPANYNYLNQELAISPLYAQDCYPENEWEEYSQAVSAVKTDRTAYYQNIVNSWTTAVCQARVNLENSVLSADYTALNEVLATLPDFNTAYSVVNEKNEAVGTVYAYDDNVFTQISNVVSSINYDLNKGSQQTVDGYTESLTQLSSQLTKNDADYTYLNKQLNIAPLYSEDCYAQEQYSAYVQAVAQAQTGLKAEEQATVNGWTTSIYNARTELENAVLPADYTALNAILDLIPKENTKLDVVNGKGEVKGSVYAYNVEIYNQIDSLRNQITTDINKGNQSVVDNFTSSLTELNGKLTQNNGVDTYLSEELAISPRYSEDCYPSDLWTAYEDAVAQAQIGTKALNQNNINSWTQAIYQARTALEKGVLPADYSSLNTAVALIPSSNQSYAVKDETGGDVSVVYDYTYDVYNQLDAIRSSIDYTLGKNAQATVDAWTQQINDKLQTLSANKADYTYVDAQLYISIRYTKDCYPQENWDTYNNALLAVVKDLPASRQGDLNTWAKAIFDARTELENSVLPGDYTALNATIATVPAENTAYDVSDENSSIVATSHKYDTTLYAQINEYVSAIKTNLNKGEQADIDAYNTQLLSLLSGLTEVKADYSYLNAQLAISPKYDESCYDATAWSAYTTTVSTVSNDKLASAQSDVNKWTVDVYNARVTLENSVLPADYSAFDTLANSLSENTAYDVKNATGTAVDTVYKYDVTKYQEITTAIGAINRNLGKNDQSTVDAAALELGTLINGLNENSANYVYVNEQLNIAPLYEESAYSAQAWAAYQAAKNKVETSKKASEQETVNNWAADIYTARATLENSISNADYTQLVIAVGKIPEENLLRNIENEKGEVVGTVYDYNNEIYTQLVSIKNSIDYTLGANSQSIIDGYTKSIDDLLAQLKENDGDYTYLLQQKNISPLYSSEYYNYSAWKNYADALAAVELNKTASYQESINEWAKEIYTTRTALENQLIAANYDALNTEIQKVPSANSVYNVIDGKGSVKTTITAYDETAFNDIKTYIASMNMSLYAIDQSTVDEYTQTLTSKYDALVMNSADYTYADIEKNTQTQYTSDKYSQASWNTYQTALAAIQTGLMANEQEKVNAWTTAIYNARTALVFAGADYTVVNQAINSVPADLTGYTVDTVNELNAAINAVNWNLDSSKQTIVDGYASAIFVAIDALKIKYADYTELDKAIKQANSYASQSELYSDFSAVNTALSNANSVSRTLDASHQSEIDSLATAIYSAISALTYLGADYSAVMALVAKMPTESEYSLYSQDSIDNLTSIYSSINWNLSGDSQNIVDQYVVDLGDAIDALVRLPYLEVKASSGAIIDRENNLIYGLKEGMTQNDLLNNYVSNIGTGSVTVKTTSAGFGTGTTVILYDDDYNETARFTVIIYGDITGDGSVDAFDVQVMKLYAVGLKSTSSLSTAQLLAVDFDGNNSITATDVAKVNSAAMMVSVISQN